MSGPARGRGPRVGRTATSLVGRKVVARVRSVCSAPVWRVRPGHPCQADQDQVAAEAPLRIRVGDHDLGVVMRTPGADDALAAGFVVGEGLLDDPTRVEGVRLCAGTQVPERSNVAEVLVDHRVPVDLSRALRTGLVASGCAVCGRAAVTEVAGRRGPGGPRLRLAPEDLSTMLATLETHQEGNARTGGLHAAGLFSAAGALAYAAEDVGRHNALDKVLGKALLEGAWPPPPVALVTSRASFDLVQKAAVAGLQVLACVSAPSSLALDLAAACDLTLVGFLRAGGFNVYTGIDRLGLEAQP